MQTANLKIEKLGNDIVLTGSLERRRRPALGGEDARPDAGKSKTEAELKTLHLLSASRRARGRFVDTCMEMRANCMLSLNVPRALLGRQSRRLAPTKACDYVRLGRMARAFEAHVRRVYPDWDRYIAVADLGGESGMLGLHVACVFEAFGTLSNGKPVRPHLGTLRACWQRVLKDFFPRGVARLRAEGVAGGLGSLHMSTLGVHDPRSFPPQRLGLYCTKSFADLSLSGWRPKGAGFTLAACREAVRAVRMAKEKAQEFKVRTGPMYKTKAHRALVEQVLEVLSMNGGNAKVRLNMAEVEHLRGRYENGEDLGFWRNLQQACWEVACAYGHA